MSIEVKVYDATTNEQIGVFDSASIAAYEFDVSRETIRKSNKGIPIKGNIYFRYGESDREYTNKAKAIVWYDAKTDAILGRFNSAVEASNKTGIPLSTIRNNCRGITKTVCKKKYYFRSPEIEFKPIHPEPYIQKGKPKPELQKSVDVFTIDTDELIGTFDSFSAAAKFIGCSPNRVSSNVNYIPSRKKQSTIFKKYYCKLHNE